MGDHRETRGTAQGRRDLSPLEGDAWMRTIGSTPGATANAAPPGTTTTTPTDVIFELARDALRLRDDFERRGYAMPYMPHESTVRATLGVAPSKGEPT